MSSDWPMQFKALLIGSILLHLYTHTAAGGGGGGGGGLYKC